MYKVDVSLIAILNRCFKDFTKTVLYNINLIWGSVFKSSWLRIYPRYLELIPNLWSTWMTDLESPNCFLSANFNDSIKLGMHLSLKNLAIYFNWFSCF